MNEWTNDNIWDLVAIFLPVKCHESSCQVTCWKRTSPWVFATPCSHGCKEASSIRSLVENSTYIECRVVEEHSVTWIQTCATIKKYIRMVLIVRLRLIMRWFIFHRNNVFINVHNWSWELQGEPENGKRSSREATGGDASELCFPLPMWRTRSQKPIVFLNGSGECTNQKRGLTT